MLWIFAGLALLLLTRLGLVPVNYANIPTLASTTLDKYFGKPGDKISLINETAKLDYLAGRLMKRLELKADGGINVRFPIQFNAADVANWGFPGNKGALKGTPANVWGSVPRRWLEWFWFKPMHEIELNKGAKEQLLDLGQMARSDVAISICNMLEEALLAPDGNYAHDGSGADFLIPFGLLYWITIDGLHVTGDTSLSVGGINPYTQALWRNQYINPVAASDGGAPITSIYQWRTAMLRGLRRMKFDSVNVYGSLAKDAKNAPTWDPTGKQRAEDMIICMDDRSEISLNDLIFAAEEDRGGDQFRPRPVFKGIEVWSSEALRISPSGYGYDADGNVLWVDRTGSYASGLWANYGQTLVINAKYLHFLGHSAFAPYVKKAYEPEGMFGVANEGTFSIQTMANSRRRGLFYLGPYATQLAA